MKRRRAFTLLELLVAMTILTLILVALAEILGMVAKISKHGTRRIDHLTQARSVLGLLERDLQSILLHRSLAAFVNEKGEPACAFYTTFQGSTGNRSVSLVEYRIDPSLEKASLLRRDFGLDFAQKTLSFQNTQSLPDLSQAKTLEMATGVIGFKIQFFQKDGRLSDRYLWNYDQPQKSSNTGAIIISMMVIDRGFPPSAFTPEQRQVIQQLSQQNPKIDETFAQAWQQFLDRPSSQNPISKKIREGIQVFERKLSLPSTLFSLSS